MYVLAIFGHPLLGYDNFHLHQSIFLYLSVEYSRACFHLAGAICSASQLVRVKTAQPWDLLPIQAQSVRFIAIPSHVWTISINTTDRYSRRPRPNSRTLPPSCPHPGALDIFGCPRCQNPNCSVSILSQYITVPWIEMVVLCCFVVWGMGLEDSNVANQCKED